MALTDEIRAACARVAERGRRVRLVPAAIEPYARTLPSESPPAPDLEPGAPDEARAAYGLQLNAINFGSGWFPTLRKPPGLSGFRTVEAALRRRGPWGADELAGVETPAVAQTMGQDPEHELMALFAQALRELGAHVVADLAALTLFADNLVPHVLRLDGVLELEPELQARIEREELIDHDSPEEVEIRACALHAVELLVAAHGSTTATAVDYALWLRGAGARYKAVPRHRARTTAY